MKENLKIKVKGQREWDEARDMLNLLGNVENYEIYMDDAYTKRDYKLITFDELRELARPKEYLNDHGKLIETNQPQDGWTPVNGRDYIDTGRIVWQRENKVETVKCRFLHQEWLDKYSSGLNIRYQAPRWENDIFVDVDQYSQLDIFNNSEVIFSLKPQTITIGSRTINKPISVKPEYRQIYFVSRLDLVDKYAKQTWVDDKFDELWLNSNLCHLTQQDAINMTDALLELMK